MNIMVVGGGGREHAIIKALKRDERAEKIYALPGNGGISADAECVPIGATDIEKIVEFADAHAIDFAVVAPDDPLCLGCVDALHAVGIRCFGPDKKAAIIEGSKVFSKELMKKYGIPTAEYQSFTEEAEAISYLKGKKLPIVIKADGLALGKGVIIAETEEEACSAVHSMMSEGIFGASGKSVVIEEFLTGPEVSVLCFTDGKTIKPMVSSMDHKRAHDNDQGKNTGGMGTVAPNPYYTADIESVCMDTIFLPTVRAMCAEGRPFKGCLYFGLMLTENGPKVIEYNCRFGDPETQVVLPLLGGSLLEIMLAVEEERLEEVKVQVLPGAACCVIIASGGYPGSYQKGIELEIGETDNENVQIIHAGTAIKDGKLVSSGGRVLGVTAKADSLKEAIKLSYAACERVSFPGSFKRNDIGARALLA